MRQFFAKLADAGFLSNLTILNLENCVRFDIPPLLNLIDDQDLRSLSELNFNNTEFKGEDLKSISNKKFFSQIERLRVWNCIYIKRSDNII
jgi:hypothetical protein